VTYPDSPAGKINRRFLERVEELHRAGVNYEVADERTVEQFARLAGHELTLGHCQYSRVVVDEGCRLKAATRALLHSVPAAAPTRTGLKVERAGVETGGPITVQWSLEKQPMNLLLLECANDVDGWWTAKFSSSAVLPDAKLKFVFADDIAAVEFNGHPLTPSISDEGSVATVDSMLVQTANALRFRPMKSGLQRPFVWLRGWFRVMSHAPFGAGPNHTLTTDGPFTLQPAHALIRRDLVADGFPFLREPVGLVGNITLPAAVVALRFDGVEADAVRLQVGEQDFGWTWRTNGEVRFAVKLAAGVHSLRLELVPNTFNAFGPHHYYGGDWPVVSPDQIKGVRNFADPADAPADTHVPAWHFRRFQLPQSVSLL